MGKASDDGASLRAAATRIMHPAVLPREELHRAISAILSTYASPQATENAEHKLHDVVIEIPNRLPHSESFHVSTDEEIRFIGFLLLMYSTASAYGVSSLGEF
ncbi:uncharacterized protein LOC119324375 [Triticum dicoccoides]|uniref:uncharacterized protein LOC119324375 n=1 Tax=Triticum dicoccoides TaxID=85692 RepID=UPI0018918476|nr:uncharacterized protein LOC119324375 [Triticum dicoccoides]XP_044411248.1 uncharacterized protein LOC123136029 [Triticum aestivum]